MGPNFLYIFSNLSYVIKIVLNATLDYVLYIGDVNGKIFSLLLPIYIGIQGSLVWGICILIVLYYVKGLTWAITSLIWSGIHCQCLVSSVDRKHWSCKPGVQGSCSFSSKFFTLCYVKGSHYPWYPSSISSQYYV